MRKSIPVKDGATPQCAILNDPNKFVVRVLGQQTFEDGIRYRDSRFVITEGNARYNTLTGECLYRADEETLIRRWFKVPEDMDEAMLAYMVRQKWLANSEGPGRGMKVKFIIFFTTVCNAHCEYCFEHGVNSMTMTAGTAKDVAKYISDHSPHGIEVKLRLFGGEPLMNIDAINVLCDGLKEHGVTFASELFTNGDRLPLLDDETLTDRWHVKNVQITLDDVGTEYERIKGLPSGAFDRLLESTKRLLRAKIHVHVRVHYHPGKGPDAPRRVFNAFRNLQGIHMYGMMLYGGGKKEDYSGLIGLEEEMAAAKVRRWSFPSVSFGVGCMADNRKHACITTDGHLSPCEHHPYGENYGSIYGGKYDEAVLKRWKAKSRNYCAGCVLYPSCGRQAECPAQGNCSEEEVDYLVERIRRAMRAKYAALRREEN